MKNISLATTYAEAFLNVVTQEQANLDSIRTELKAITQVYENSAPLRNVLSHPSVSGAQKCELVLKIVKALHVSSVTEKFMFVIAQNNRISRLSDIYTEFESAMLSRSGKVKAVVKTVCELTEDLKKDLDETFKRKTGKDIVWQYEIDSSLLGGVLIQIEDKIWDGTLCKQLEQLKYELQKI